MVEHSPSHVFALFSGGHDSLCSTALAAKHPAFTAVVHINTGVGIEQTRTFVRETCEKRRVVLVTGIRVEESQRRMSAVMAQPVHRIGAQVWVNPILAWTKRDCHDFMDAEGLPRNQVVDLLHRSGECLCGALAHASEIKEIERWFPVEAASLHAYEDLAAGNGHPETVWAGRLRRGISRSQLPLCTSCQAAA